jgi:hypothetical protein
MSPTPSTPSQPEPSGQLLERARQHPVARRREVVTSFFTRWPGSDAHPLGLGRALWEFQEWEIDSGRLRDDGGSPWWSAVNGRLVSDLEDAAQGAPGPWADYIATLTAAGERAQSALWHAHQHSISRGADAAAPLLGSETPEEQEFARLALSVVDMAAAVQHPTSGGGLGRQTRQHYPRTYPCTSDDLAAVRTMLGG